jgi:hypothetical protein
LPPLRNGAAFLPANVGFFAMDQPSRSVNAV